MTEREMQERPTIAAAVRRLEDAVSHRPGFGGATNRSRTTIGEGVRCTSVEGDWTVHTDLSAALGGMSSAPTPGVLVRAALGACMAMSYRLRAERAGLAPLTITVDVEADSQLAGMLLTTATAPPGFTGVRYHVDLECDAHDIRDDAVQRVLEDGDRLSPVLDTIRRATPVVRTATIRTTTIRPAGG